MVGVAKRVSERRTEHLLSEILIAQGWDLRRPPQGDLLRQQEYRSYSELSEIFKHASKSGSGFGLPEAVLVDRATITPFAVIEAKANVKDLEQAVEEAVAYSSFCVDAGYYPLAVGLVGTSEDDFDIRVLKWIKNKWLPITYEGQPISWIPNRSDLQTIAVPSGPRELRPSVPPPEVLAFRGDEINRLLRESGIKDEFRPAVVGAIMLALWASKGNIRKDKDNILSDINEACKKAFWRAKKADLATSLRVDEANDKLAIKARRIVSILERLNVTVLTAEHDYLGQLYETFFRYTGGNTIGQYFTPRHITSLMADLCEVGHNDVVLDPACGTGGFLISAMIRILNLKKLSRTQLIKLVEKRLIGFEDEPITAALCVANMILRGDGSVGIHRADCFTSEEYPIGEVTTVLMNPPFPHRKTDTPPDEFIDRALEGLQQRGRMAVIVPMSLLVRRDKQEWRTRLLSKHTLNGVISLPDELFQPYASSNTAILIVTKGVKHNNRMVYFARIENDGYRLRKGIRISRDGSEIPSVLDSFRSHGAIPGICGLSDISSGDEWAPGAYIPARPLTSEQVKDEARALIRSKSAMVVKYAPSFKTILDDLTSGEIKPRDFRQYGSRKESPSIEGNVVGTFCEIYYGQKELETKEGLSKGNTLVISSTGAENGCYGFYDYDWIIAPPIVTVPRTGSIGEAHVQEWPCGATSDCLILLPRPKVPLEVLYIVAAVIRQEKWRFNYGRKMTPARIAQFPVPIDKEILTSIHEQLEQASSIEEQALGRLPMVEKRKPAKVAERLSLYPLSPEEAMSAFLEVDPEKVKAKEKESKKAKKADEDPDR
jgi:hypothetical protein